MHCDPRGGHNRKYFDKTFFKKWSQKMAYVTGLIYADGAIEDVRKSSRTCYTTISSKDKQLLEDVRKAISSNHNIYIKRAQYNMFPGGKRYFCQKGYILRIGSKSLYEDLILLGITPRKSLTLKFPNVPDNLLSYFVRGYFDGDGCINIVTKKVKLKPKLTVIFTSGSKLFLIRLCYKLNKSIGTSRHKIKLQSNAFRLRYNKLDSLKLLNFMYKEIKKTPFLQRKYDTYQKYILF